MAKPRLLFISSVFPDSRAPYRGLDNAALLHHLADQWEIAVIAPRPILPFGRKGWRARTADEAFFPRYVATHYLPRFGRTKNHRMMAASLRGFVGELRGAFQLALSAWVFPDSCAVALLADEFKFPFFAIAHGLDVHDSLQNARPRRIVAESMSHARGVITHSAELARRLAEAGTPREKLHPIINGVDLDRFRPADTAQARQELGLPVNQRIVLFVGNFVPPKNPVLLVEAFGRLCSDDRFSNALLVFVGGGPLEGEINFHASRGASAGRVMIAGRQTPDTVARFMQSADVLCVPGIDEGIPNVILEAFACGLPVVATRTGGIPEVHTKDFLGLLVAPRDLDALSEALKVVLDIPPARARVHDYARQFTWRRSADQYHALLNRSLQ